MLHLKTELLEVLTVQMLVDISTGELIALKQSVPENVQMLNGTIISVVVEFHDYVERAECVAKPTQDRHRNTSIMAAAFQNITKQYRRIVNDINQRRISLANMASILHDAMSSVFHGYLPISLIPPSTLTKILDSFDVNGLNEAIPKTLIAAYSSFEVVSDAYISNEGLHLLLEFPMYTGHGVFEVY